MVHSYISALIQIGASPESQVQTGDLGLKIYLFIYLFEQKDYCIRHVRLKANCLWDPFCFT